MLEDEKQYIIDKYDIKDYKEPTIIIPDLSKKSGIILIVGSSGSGKSTILKSLNPNKLVIDYSKPIIDNFSSPLIAEELLLAMGLRSIPTWFRPFDKVSNGERHRAESALAIDQNINCIDEFTSVVDRDTAKSLSVALHKYFKKHNKTIFVATPHFDIQEWLCPDVVYNTDTQKFVQSDFLRRPDIDLHIKSSNVEDWNVFKKHHYLTSQLPKSVHCYSAFINDKLVAFLAIMHGTSGSIKSYWRESRLVVLPEFQGLGIGKTLSDSVAEFYTSKGYRYFSKTAHSALGNYRDNSPRWKGTSKNKKKRNDYFDSNGELRHQGRFKTETLLRDYNRLTFSHEFIK